MLVWGLLVVLLLRWPGSPSSEDSIPERRASNTETGAWHVNVTIVPPAYSGRPRVTVVDPDRVEALEGSALHLRVDQVAPPLRARTSKSTRPLTRRDDGIQTAVVTLNESDYVALEPAGPATAGTRLIAVTVAPDRAPVSVVTVPGKDLLLPDANRRVNVAGTATDDIGLTRLELRFTTISGSGEQFDFKEGSAVITIERDSADAGGRLEIFRCVRSALHRATPSSTGLSRSTAAALPVRRTPTWWRSPRPVSRHSPVLNCRRIGIDMRSASR